jgi:hypothetical protein
MQLNADVNLIDELGQTALIYSALLGNEELLFF